MVRANGASEQWLVSAALLLALVAAPDAGAMDPWEAGNGDNQPLYTKNTLSHGFVQQHDLDDVFAPPSNDVDCMIVPTLAGHSYEARINGTRVEFDWGMCGSCPQFERVDVNGAILTEDVGVVNEGGGESNDRSVRWIATANTTLEYVRVTGDTSFPEGPNEVYTIRFWDTTYSVPRWNNSSGQVTVFLIQNLVQAPVTVNVDFYNAAGLQLASTGTTLQPHGLFVFNTGTVPQLANQAGHAYVSHTAGYGGLAGKAVALEPATGFSFDTPLMPIPD